MQFLALLLCLCVVLGLLVPRRLRASMLSSVICHPSIYIAHTALLLLHNVQEFPQSYSSICCVAFLLVIIFLSGLNAPCYTLPKGVFVVPLLSLAAPHWVSTCLGNYSYLPYLIVDGLLWAATDSFYSCIYSWQTVANAPRTECFFLITQDAVWFLPAKEDWPLNGKLLKEPSPSPQNKLLLLIAC